MNVDVAVNGRPWKVAIEDNTDPGKVTVVVKGQPRVVELDWIDRDTLSLIDRTAVHDVRIQRRANGAIGVDVDGKVFDVLVSPVDTLASRDRGRFSDARTRKSAPAPGSASHSVKAPMPGRVVRVLVGLGDRVTTRQAVVVVEAMKMENELRTPTSGTVIEIKAVEGGAVEAGATLMVIAGQDPHAPPL